MHSQSACSGSFFVLKDCNTCQIIMLFADLSQIQLCIFMHYFLHIYAFFS